VSDSNQEAYGRRIRRVVDYIEAHLDGDLSVDRLSIVAGFSKFHFHRQFSAHTETSVARLVKLLRLKRATWALAFAPEKKIIEIALEAGFSNPETFCRAFKSLHEQTPSEFRAASQWRDWTNILSIPKKELEIEVKAEIKIFTETNIALMQHRAPPGEIMNTVSKFIEWRKATTCAPESRGRTFGVIHDDPDSTDADKFRFDLCAELRGPLLDNDVGVTESSIPTGRCAVVRHEGTLDTIGPKVRELYCTWLPESGEELRDFPCFFHYVKRMPKVSEHEQVTDIYLPLK